MINQFPRLSMNNRHVIESSTTAGCFHCCQIFETSKIKNYTDEDKTCICPLCEQDCVVGPNQGFEFNEETLKKAKKYWF